MVKTHMDFLEDVWRDKQNKPYFHFWLELPREILNIKRYDHFPFYIFPMFYGGNAFADKFMKFLDYLVDAHELERNTQDFGKNFYQRTNYVVRNFHRYSNDTMANLMFDTKCRTLEYDTMNAIIDRQYKIFYGAATLYGIFAFSFSSFFFRYRRLNKTQVVVVGSALFLGQKAVNDILYKTIVDRKVIAQAREYGFERHVQPNGTHNKPRGTNYTYY